MTFSMTGSGRACRSYVRTGDFILFGGTKAPPYDILRGVAVTDE